MRQASQRRCARPGLTPCEHLLIPTAADDAHTPARLIASPALPPTRPARTDAGGVPGNDLYALKHRNGLVVVGLAARHAALRSGGELRVTYVVDGDDRRELAAAATGKRKRKGQQKLGAAHAIAELTCEGSGDGESSSECTRYRVHALVDGTLLEVNSALDSSRAGSKPCGALLRSSAEWRGYVGIVMAYGDAAKRMCVGASAGNDVGTLLSLDEYEALRGIAKEDSPYR